jgi:hypothetical protein
MNDFIRPDKCFQVPIEGGELKVSPSIDFLHYFPNGAWMLKYFDGEHDPPRFCNVLMTEQSAYWLMTNCGVEVMAREYMSESEHDQYLGWAATHQLAELDFEITED